MQYCKDHNDMLKNVTATKINVEWLVKREHEKQQEWESRQKTERDTKSIHDTSFRGWATWLIALSALVVSVFRGRNGN